MSEITDDILTAFVTAYDEARCRLNEQWHGGKCEPMSEANKANVLPIMRAALEAAAPLIEAQERERCARVADAQAEEERGYLKTGEATREIAFASLQTAKQIAQAIRSRA